MRANLELQRLTNVDGLTGLSNRRYFDEYLSGRMAARHARRGTPLSLLMIDVDHFKLYNDTYGHVAGDEVLRALAARSSGAAGRARDLAARFGGEEFVVVLGATELAGCRRIAEELRQYIEVFGDPALPIGGRPLRHGQYRRRLGGAGAREVDGLPGRRRRQGALRRQEGGTEPGGDRS